MKTLSIILLLFICMGTLVSFPEKVVGQSEQEQALKSFQKLVDRFSAFFLTKQYLVYKFRSSSTKTGVLVQAIQYSLSKKISYDVEKTQSLVSPFIGHMSLELSNKTNATCGTIPSLNICGKKTFYGWDNTDDAVRNITKDSCYKKPYFGAGTLYPMRAFLKPACPSSSPIPTARHRPADSLVSRFFRCRRQKLPVSSYRSEFFCASDCAPCWSDRR
jgi:hypothetical protein